MIFRALGGRVVRTGRGFLAALLCFAAIGVASASELSQKDEELYREAFAAVKADRWQRAHLLASHADDDLLAKTIQWLDFTRHGTDASFAELDGFIAENPDWPDQRALQASAERAIRNNLSAQEVIAWFAERTPVSAAGRIHLADAWRKSGRTEEGIASLRRVWIEEDIPKQEAKDFYRVYKTFLRPEDHIARLDRLLWDGRRHAARRMLRVVDADHRTLGEARLRLMEQKPSVDAAIAAVPEALRDDTGLIYERLRWRRRKGFDESAREILLGPPDELVREGAWWRERAIQVREALDEGLITTAYELASQHGQTGGVGLADAEWLSGWITLRFLEDPETAFAHFARMKEGVNYPISLARANYWAGRALEASGEAGEARAWYAEAAKHWYTFYGQLAALQLAARGERIWPARVGPIEATSERIEDHELAEVARQLAAIGESKRIKRFLIGLADLGEDANDVAAVARLALELGRPDFSIAVAKQAIKRGLEMVPYAYPLVSLPLNAPFPEKALVMALVRQESAFDEKAVSAAGARGLMQLMPATARQVAKALRISMATDQLTADPAYNLKLGTTYLKDLLDAYDGSYVLALAAYNGGPRNLRRWITRYGDPRDAEVDVIDWIESVPFSETRNYIQRVLETVQVYRVMLGQSYSAPMLKKDFERGRWS